MDSDDESNREDQDDSIDFADDGDIDESDLEIMRGIC